VGVIDAILFYYGKHGHLPTARQLDKFSAREQFAKATHKGRPWHEYVKQAVEQIREMAWPEPPAYGAPAPESWRPLQKHLLAESERNRRYTHQEVIEAVRCFMVQLSGANPTDRRWREFSRGQHGVPSLGVIKHHGGLKQLVGDASRADWQERSQVWLDPRAIRRESRVKPTAANQLAARVRSPRAKILLAAFGNFSRNEATAKELAELLGWTVPKVRGWLEVLRAAELVEQTEQWQKSKRQRYRLRQAQAADLTPSR